MTEPARSEPTPSAPARRAGLRPVGRLATRQLGRPVRVLVTGWRRSIRLRVVVSIVVLSAVVVGAVGLLVTSQIADGLVSRRVAAAVTESTSETQTARDRLASAGGNDFDPATQLRQLVESLVSRGEVRGFDVVVRGPMQRPDGSTPPAGVSSTPGVDVDSVPPALAGVVQRQGGVSWTYTSIRFLPERERGPAEVAGVVVGSEVVLPSDGGTYAVFYLFPMDDEARTLALLRRVLLTSGALLLVLVAGVAGLVTRQVITPVRLARRVAERIASGRLEERMTVVGEDDIARLATSFNSMADALQQQIRQLVELSRVQRTFVSDVSHELRTPLTTVRMASDVLHDAREGFDPMAARAAELLQTELDRFETLLIDLLEISRFDAGAAALDLEDLDLVDVVRRVVASTSAVARHQGVRVRVVAPVPCVVEADHRRVERVLRNLVTNAIDHAGEAAEVVVRVGGDSHAGAVTVRDHGVGLAPGQSVMVFNRFWRADPARARTTGGTGLGLSIALEDARLHGGWLQAWGTPQGGSQFRMTLPRRAGDELLHSPLPLVPDDALGAVR